MVGTIYENRVTPSLKEEVVSLKDTRVAKVKVISPDSFLNGLITEVTISALKGDRWRPTLPPLTKEPDWEV